MSSATPEALAASVPEASAPAAASSPARHALSALVHSTGKARKTAVEQLAGLVGDALAGNDVEEFFDAFCDMVFAAGATWTDNASRRFLSSSLASLAETHGDAFASPFLSSWAALVNAVAPKSKDESMLQTYLTWGSDVIASVSSTSVFATSESAPLVTECATALVALTSALSSPLPAPSASHTRAARALARALSSSSPLSAAYAAAVKKHLATRTLAKASSTLHLAADAFAGTVRAPASFAAAKKSLFSVLTETILPARDPPSEAVMAAISPVFALLTPADLVASEGGEGDSLDLVPVLLRTARRSAPIAFTVLGAVIKAGPTNLVAATLASLLPPAISEVRATDAARRTLGHSFFSALSPAVTLPNARMTVVTALSDYIFGRNGCPAASTSDMRVSLVAALGAFAGVSDTEETSTAMSEAVCAVLAKETIAAGKNACFTALSSILSALHPSVPAPAAAVTALTDALSAASTECAPVYAGEAALTAVLAALEAHHAATSSVDAPAAPLSSQNSLARAVAAPKVSAKLVELLAQAEAKPASVRGVGLMAAAVLALVTSTAKSHKDKDEGSAGSSASSSLTVGGMPSQLVALLSSNTSFINTTSSVADTAVYVTLAGAVLSNHSHLVSRSSEKLRLACLSSSPDPAVLPGFLRSLIRARAHKNHAVRARASAVIDPLLASPGMVGAGAYLLRAFATELDAAVTSSTVVADHDDDEDAAVADISPTYVTNYDGHGHTLVLRRFFRHSAPPADPLRVATPPTALTGVWGPLFSVLLVGTDAVSVALAVAIACHPALVTTPADASATVATAMKKVGLVAAKRARSHTPPVASVPETSEGKGPNKSVKHRALVPVAAATLLAPAAVGSALASLLLTGPNAMISSSLVEHRRSAIVALAYIASAAPATFAAALRDPLLTHALLPAQAVLDLSPYELAVLQTPSWMPCPLPDPMAAPVAEQEKAAVEAKVKRAAKTAGMTAEEALFVNETVVAVQARRSALVYDASVSQLEREAAIRDRVSSLAAPVTAALAAVEAIAVSAPAVAHSELLRPALPLLHELVFGARIVPSRAGVAASTVADNAVAAAIAGVDIPHGSPTTAAAVAVGSRCLLLKPAAERVLIALARTTDVAAADPAVGEMIGLAAARAWSEPATRTLAVVQGAGSLVAYRDDRTAGVVAMGRACAAAAAAAAEGVNVGAGTFALLLPSVDLLLRYAPVSLASSHESAEEDAAEDVVAAIADAVDGVPVDNTMANFIRLLTETVAAGVSGAASLLAHVALPAAASHNALAATPVPVGSQYPVPAMLSLVLAALARLPEQGEAAERITEALLRLASTLRLDEIEPLVSDSGIFSQNKAVRAACLQALAKVHILLTAETLTTVLPSAESEKLQSLLLRLAVQVWTLRKDAAPAVSSSAEATFTTLPLASLVKATGKNATQMLTQQISFLLHSHGSVRACAAAAAAELVTEQPSLGAGFFTALQETWLAHGDLVRPAATIRDKPEFISRAPARLGAISALASLVPTGAAGKHSEAFFATLCGFGLADLDDDVWDAALQAGFKAAHWFGAGGMKRYSPLVAVLRTVIANPTSPVADSLAPSPPRSVGVVLGGAKPVPANTDADKPESLARVKEGAILLLGTLARYFPTASSDLVETVATLRQALTTPSVSVQRSVARCLTPLTARLPGAAHLKGCPELDSLCEGLLASALTDDDAITRRGSALGLAAVVSGLSGAALGKYGVVDAAMAALTEKSLAKRHGGLLVIEALFGALGKLMTPYVTRLLPAIIILYGSPEQQVRDAARAAVRALMQSLTIYGVRLVMPLVTVGLKHRSSRTKVESIDLLSSMTSLSPRELAACLPTVIPRILDALADPSTDVQAAARNALGSVAAAVRNPEVSRMTGLLVAALSDAANHKVLAQALNTLFTTTFVHYVDPAALAFIMPLVRAGLRDNDARLKVTAVQIAGAVSQVVAGSTDLEPYSSHLVKSLKSLLMDAHPETRQVTARALAAMSQGKLNASFLELKEQLIGLLLQLEGVRIPTSADSNVYASYGTSSVQRSGAALGLAQLFLVEGIETLQAFIASSVTEVLAPGSDAKPQVRDGFFVFLDACITAFGSSCAVALDAIMPLMLRGLSDSDVHCREAALKLGTNMAITFATSKASVMLPSLVEALVDPDPRTRFASVQLVGSLLLRLAGLSGKLVVAEQDSDPNAPNTTILNKEESAVTNAKQAQLIEETVGVETRNEIYTALYLMQSDVVTQVSRIAWRVWSVVTLSTTKMLENIMGSLVNTILADLTCPFDWRQATANAALADLTNKFGDRVLRSVVPILLENLESPEVASREGAMLGLGAITRSGRKLDMLNYMPDFFIATRTALCDSSPAVRAGAADAFAELVKAVGERAVTNVVPHLLEALEKKHDKYLSDVADMRAAGKDDAYIAEERDGAEDVIDGLQHILRGSTHLSERYICGYAIPHFVAPPVTAFHARCLAATAQALGKNFGGYVDTVVSSMLEALGALGMEIDALGGYDDDDEDEDEDDVTGDKALLKEKRLAEATMLKNVETLIAPLEDEAPAVLDTLLCRVNNEDGELCHRIAAVKMLQAFFAETKMDLSSQMHPIWSALIPLLVEDAPATIAAAADCVAELSARVSKDVLMKNIGYIRAVFNDTTGRDAKTGVRDIAEVPGIAVNGCFAAFATFFQHGLVSGNANVRVQASGGLADLVEIAPTSIVQKHAIKLTGPLIRSFGDRLEGEVRLNILQTLANLVTKVGPALKAFQAQLLTTFMKALSDESRSIRDKAAGAIVALPLDSRRIDGLFSDLMDSVEENEKHDVAASAAKAAFAVLDSRAFNEHVSPENVARCLAIASRVVQSESDAFRVAGSALVGRAAGVDGIDAAAVQAAVTSVLTLAGVGAATRPPWFVRQGAAMVLSSVLVHAAESFKEVVGYRPAVRFLAVGFRDENALACTAAIRFAGRLIVFAADEDDSQVVQLLVTELFNLCAGGGNKTPEQIAVAALSQVRAFVEKDEDALEDYLTVVVPGCVRARTGANKAVRKEADTILYHVLGFGEDAKTGMANAEEFAKENMPAETIEEFLALCKRSVAKAGKKAGDDKEEADE